MRSDFAAGSSHVHLMIWLICGCITVPLKVQKQDLAVVLLEYFTVHFILQTVLNNCY